MSEKRRSYDREQIEMEFNCVQAFKEIVRTSKKLRLLNIDAVKVT